MADPFDPPPGPDPNPVDPAAEAEAGPASVTPTGTRFHTGQRWRAFQIGESMGSGTPERFRAVDVGSMEPVILTVGPSTSSLELRRQVWVLLQDLPRDNALSLLEASEEEGLRIEVTPAPPLQDLRDWLVEHPADKATVERLVRQLAPVLTGMHSRGVAHLNIRPETIYVTPGVEGPTFTLGGLSDSIPVAQDHLIDANVDPLYAPPEAAGLFRHEPGAGLFAWDWWSLGRVLQEYVQGRHIIGHHLTRDLSRMAADIGQRAEAMLFEREPAGVRAGAVELMKGLDPSVEQLLRGLLTASRDGRWKSAEVESWSHGRPVRDRYSLPRNARLFVWRGQSYSIAEAADYFAQESNWDEGEANLFSPPSDKTTLLSFIRGERVHSALAERLEAVLAKSDLPAWQDLPVAARRTALAAAAWCVCADNGPPASLRLKGRRLDWIGIQSWVNSDAAVELTPLFHALTAQPYIELVETLDGEAARSLTLLAQGAREAIAHGVHEGWIKAGDHAVHAGIFRLAVQPARDLEARWHALQGRYATTRTPVLSGYFNAPKPERWKLLLVIHTGDHAAEFLYVSHAERNLERYTELGRQGHQLAAFVFWLGLRRTLAAAPWLFLPWWLVAPAWIAFAGTMYFKTHDTLVPLVALAGILALRALAQAHIARLVHRCDPEARPWSWADHAGRCKAEAARVRPSDAGTNDLPSLIARFHALVREMADLPLDHRPGPLPPQPRFAGLWGSAAAGLLVVLIGVVQLVTSGGGSVPAEAAASPAPSAPPAGEKADPTGVAGRIAPVTAPPGLPPGVYEEINDGFGRRLRGPLLAWEVPAGRVGRPVVVQQQLPASVDQRALAVIHGKRALLPFPSTGIDAVIAVRVPTGVRGGDRAHALRCEAARARRPGRAGGGRAAGPAGVDPARGPHRGLS
jgi:serine/threonine protein kinase